MYSAKQILSSSGQQIILRENLRDRELLVEFPVQIEDWRKSTPSMRSSSIDNYNRVDLFRFNIPFSHLHQIRFGHIGLGNQFCLYISQDCPPRFTRYVNSWQMKGANPNSWNDNQAWFRQTDVVYNPRSLHSSPVALKKAHQIINLGRWTTYRLVFDAMSGAQVFTQMREALKDYNVQILVEPELEIVRTSLPDVWDILDRPARQRQTLGEALNELIEPGTPQLPFNVRYQLEVCLAHGVLSEYSLDQKFVHCLSVLEAEKAQSILELVSSQKKRVHDPMSIFDKKTTSSKRAQAQIPVYCTLMRSATVTPTTIYFHTPTVETSNRAIRQYPSHADGFLRVRFSDEKNQVQFIVKVTYYVY